MPIFRPEPPPAGIQITVELRDLWLALCGFGIDDPFDDEYEASRRVWDQVDQAERELGGRSDAGR
jgi:hypothetical protein